MLSEQLFAKQLDIERRRTERSGHRFVLMLVDCKKLAKTVASKQIEQIPLELEQSIRETDIKGWYSASVIGVIFTEIGTADEEEIIRALSKKASRVISGALNTTLFDSTSVSFHVYPGDWYERAPGEQENTRFCPDLTGKVEGRKLSFGFKRSIDIAGSLFLLLVCSPLLLLISAAIKLTSRGPVFFSQTRLGQYGRRFTFFKFRSMYASADPRLHEKYVSEFIAGKLTAETEPNGAPVYKMTNDPRITPVGRFLRRTSLDELPQLLNVLFGQMSLVGPRPPLDYEFARYAAWHKRRLLAVKPGLTGLWQVAGRSKVSFDEMVRLDLQYARSWSLWMDMRILLKTPRAVLNFSGAY